MINKIIMNNLEMGSLASGYIFTKLVGFGNPEIRIDIKDNGNFVGAKLGTYNYGRRIMQIEGKIVAENRSDYEEKRQALQEAVDLMSGLSKIFITTSAGSEVEIVAILNDKPVLDYNSGEAVMSDFRIELVAPMPFFLRSIQTVVTLTPLSGGGGAIPSAIPFSLANGTQGIFNTTNIGNCKSYPKITLYGGMTNPVITNSTTGKSLTLTRVLGVGDYVEIDVLNHTAVLNGTENVFADISGDWWLIEKGDNTLILNSTTPDETAKAVVIFNSTYLGL